LTLLDMIKVNPREVAYRICNGKNIDRIVSVRLNKSLIAIVGLNFVEVWTTPPPNTPGKLKAAMQGHQTADNPYALICLGKRFLIVPAKTAGQVRVVDLPHHRNVRIIPSHT
ncbi:hypothetical protein LTS18_012781, partial [Coniosporium uncinatum]